MKKNQGAVFPRRYQLIFPDGSEDQEAWARSFRGTHHQGGYSLRWNPSLQSYVFKQLGPGGEAAFVAAWDYVRSVGGKLVKLK